MFMEMFVAALLLTAQSWKWASCPSPREGYTTVSTAPAMIWWIFRVMLSEKTQSSQVTWQRGSSYTSCLGWQGHRDRAQTPGARLGRGGAGRDGDAGGAVCWTPLVWTVSEASPWRFARCYHCMNWVKGSLQSQNWKFNFKKPLGQLYTVLLYASCFMMIKHDDIQHALWIRIISYQISMCFTDLETIWSYHKS